MRAAQIPGNQRTNEITNDGQDDRPAKSLRNPKRNDVCNAVLKTTKDKERDSKQDAEFLALAIDCDGEVHNDAT